MLRIIILSALVATAAGCSTVEGMGQDISAGARTVRNAM